MKPIPTIICSAVLGFVLGFIIAAIVLFLM